MLVGCDGSGKSPAGGACGSTRLEQDTKIAKRTKRAVVIDHKSVGTVGGSTAALLTGIGGTQDSLEVRRDSQANDAPQHNKD